MDPLYQIFDNAKSGGFANFSQNLPAHITENLASNIDLRPYQVEALNRYLYYCDNYQNRTTTNLNLLFNMATGSGKTVIMSALILDLFKRGYNKFVFFVNRDNIVQKTIDNFTNPASSKYLFAQSISIDGQTPNIKAVDSLNAGASDGDIQILFTTVQKLHIDLLTPRENRISLEDLAEEKIVLLSDEAHHINAWTGGEKVSGDEAVDKNTWEHSVQSVFLQNLDNVLMEFTATIDTGNTNIATKYNDVLIYKYDLKEFRNDGYSKDIQLYSVHDEVLARMLQAVVISQYRLMVAEAHGIILKPVILFKSKTIKESLANRALFNELIASLSEGDITETLAFENARLVQIRKFLKIHNISGDAFVGDIKIAFNPERIVNVNDEKESVQHQIDINTLEVEDNRIRVVFTVDKLNEGWDVLNLYDIVRLYDTRDGQYSRGGDYRPGKTTTSEAQLIGRGARYWPFKISDDQPPAMRKYDKDIDNELRILEELYYHSPRDTDYLIEIRSALVKSGMMDQDEPKTVTLSLKDNFKQKPVYKTGYVYVNKLEDNPHADKKTAMDYLSDVSQIEIKLPTHFVSVDEVFSDGSQLAREEVSSKDFVVGDIPGHIFAKALDKQFKFYNFASLRRYLPCLKAKSDFQEMLAELKLKVSGNKDDLYSPTPGNWMIIANGLLRQLQPIIETKDAPKVGSKIFKCVLLKDVFKSEKKIIVEKADGHAGIEMSRENDEYYLDLQTRDWYVYNDDFGTGYEKKLVKLINNKVDELSAKWDELHLIRNEKDLKLYAFSDGSAFMPDYLLLLQNSDETPATYYVFIEPKGENIEVSERWKEDFLLQLEDNAVVEKLFENHDDDIKIIGLPFYQPAREGEFCETFNQL